MFIAYFFLITILIATIVLISLHIVYPSPYAPVVKETFSLQASDIDIPCAKDKLLIGSLPVMEEEKTIQFNADEKRMEVVSQMAEVSPRVFQEGLSSLLDDDMREEVEKGVAVRQKKEATEDLILDGLEWFERLLQGLPILQNPSYPHPMRIAMVRVKHYYIMDPKKHVLLQSEMIVIRKKKSRGLHIVVTIAKHVDRGTWHLVEAITKGVVSADLVYTVDDQDHRGVRPFDMFLHNESDPLAVSEPIIHMDTEEEAKYYCQRKKAIEEETQMNVPPNEQIPC